MKHTEMLLINCVFSIAVTGRIGYEEQIPGQVKAVIIAIFLLSYNIAKNKFTKTIAIFINLSLIDLHFLSC